MSAGAVGALRKTLLKEGKEYVQDKKNPGLQGNTAKTRNGKQNSLNFIIAG